MKKMRNMTQIMSRKEDKDLKLASRKPSGNYIINIIISENIIVQIGV
jgi:hypothetical protein